MKNLEIRVSFERVYCILAGSEVKFSMYAVDEVSFTAVIYKLDDMTL